MVDKKLEQELKEEFQRWQLANMNPAGIHVNGFELDVRTHAIVDLLIEAGIFTQEEADEMYQRLMLKRLTAIREAHELAQMEKQIAVAQKAILDPHGRPFN